MKNFRKWNFCFGFRIISSVMCALLLLAGCGKPADVEIVAPAGENQKTEAGPYQVEFTGADQTYGHSMKGQPRSNEAKIEYNLTTVEKSKVSLLKTELKITGCPASQVSYATYWIPDSKKPNEGQLVLPGLSFEVQASVPGVLMHVLRGLDGCSDVEFLTSLKRSKMIQPNPHFPVGQACEGVSVSDSCKVMVYCREQNPLSNYVEVEVWSRAYGLALQKYMKRSDGTRGLMSSESVTSSSTSGRSTFTGSNSSLGFDRTSGVGRFSQYSGGQTFPTDLDCAYLN